MAAAKGLGHLSYYANDALHGITAFLGTSDMSAAAAVWRPMAAACLAAALHRSCQQGRVAVHAAKDHLSAVEEGQEIKTTAEVSTDVAKAMSSLRIAEGRHYALLSALASAMSAQQSTAVPVQPISTQKMLDELGEVVKLLQRQRRREEFTAGWSNYFNLYGGMGNNMQTMGRVAMSGYLSGEGTDQGTAQ
mmetsp:Transcript_64334/g.161961  ORF Transcript_64334/g.161961 Transcript_64334/m.161961 type:complete len:191 (-) Transcript_64334:377-949(-)